MKTGKVKGQKGFRTLGIGENLRSTTPLSNNTTPAPIENAPTVQGITLQATHRGTWIFFLDR
jgi:hypothetical protein